MGLLGKISLIFNKSKKSTKLLTSEEKIEASHKAQIKRLELAESIEVPILELIQMELIQNRVISDGIEIYASPEVLEDGKIIITLWGGGLNDPILENQENIAQIAKKVVTQILEQYDLMAVISVEAMHNTYTPTKPLSLEIEMNTLDFQILESQKI